MSAVTRIELAGLSRVGSRVRVVCAAAVVSLLLVLCGSGSAFGAVRWDVSSVANSSVAPGGSVEFVVMVTNLGDVATDGSDVTFTASFPAGLTPVSTPFSSMPPCGIVAQVLTCSGPVNVDVNGDLVVKIVADAASDASGVQTVSFDVSGGGAVSTVQSADPVLVSSVEPPFGIDAFDAVALDEVGDEVTQAGGHPDVLLTSLDFNTRTEPIIGPRYPVEDVKDVTVDLPPGFVGSVAGLGECTIPELGNGTGVTNPQPLCAPTSQVGILTYRVDASSRTTRSSRCRRSRSEPAAGVYGGPAEGARGVGGPSSVRRRLRACPGSAGTRSAVTRGSGSAEHRGQGARVGGGVPATVDHRVGPPRPPGWTSAVRASASRSMSSTVVPMPRLARTAPSPSTAVSRSTSGCAQNRPSRTPMPCSADR